MRNSALGVVELQIPSAHVHARGMHTEQLPWQLCIGAPEQRFHATVAVRSSVPKPINVFRGL